MFHHFNKLKENGDKRGFQKATFSKMSSILKTEKAIKI